VDLDAKQFIVQSCPHALLHASHVEFRNSLLQLQLLQRVQQLWREECQSVGSIAVLETCKRERAKTTENSHITFALSAAVQPHSSCVMVSMDAHTYGTCTHIHPHISHISPHTTTHADHHTTTNTTLHTHTHTHTRTRTRTRTHTHTHTNRSIDRSSNQPTTAAHESDIPSLCQEIS
jgi:hypothetical protein